MWYENDSSTRRFGESTIITLDMENAPTTTITTYTLMKKRII